MATSLKLDGPQRAKRTIALAHGAGAGMNSPFMETFATSLAGRGIRVARFEFPYMGRRTASGKPGPPDREPVLKACWIEVVQQLRATMRRGDLLVVAGKSMGGRIASMIAEEVEADGLVCLGYPFHPPGRPEKLRTEHLQTFSTPTLILQGERDPFGNATEFKSIKIDRRIEISWAPDGDHSLKPRKSSGRTEAENWASAVQAMKSFVRGL